MVVPWATSFPSRSRVIRPLGRGDLAAAVHDRSLGEHAATHELRTKLRSRRPSRMRRAIHAEVGQPGPLSRAGLVPMTTVASSSSELATRGISPLRATVSTVCGAWRSLASTSK